MRSTATDNIAQLVAGNSEKDGALNGSADATEKSTENPVETIKEKVSDVVEDKKAKIGKKGKSTGKDDKVWASNGYAYAPRWPQVS